MAIFVNTTQPRKLLEDIKKEIGSAIAQVKEEHMDVRGRDLMGGLPKTIKISFNRKRMNRYSITKSRYFSS